MHRYAQIYVYMHGYSSDTRRYWRIYTSYTQICTDIIRYNQIIRVCKYMHRYRSDTHRYYKILTHMHRYEHLRLDPEIGPWDWFRWDWTQRLDLEIGSWAYKHICTYMHRYMYICTDIALIHADIGGYILDINRYAQICTDMDLYAQILMAKNSYLMISDHIKCKYISWYEHTHICSYLFILYISVYIMFIFCLYKKNFPPRSWYLNI